MPRCVAARGPRQRELGSALRRSGAAVRCAPPCGTGSEPCQGSPPGSPPLDAARSAGPSSRGTRGLRRPQRPAQRALRLQPLLRSSRGDAERPQAAVRYRRQRINSYSNWAVTLQAFKLRTVKS